MSQDKILLSFRKRLKKRGYTEIHISKDKTTEGNYTVSAVEPLANSTVTTSMPLINFYYKMR